MHPRGIYLHDRKSGTAGVTGCDRGSSKGDGGWEGLREKQLPEILKVNLMVTETPKGGLNSKLVRW